MKKTQHLEHVRFGFVHVQFVDDLLQNRVGHLVDDSVARLTRADSALSRLHVKNRQHQTRRLTSLQNKRTFQTIIYLFIYYLVTLEIVHGAIVVTRAML